MNPLTIISIVSTLVQAASDPNVQALIHGGIKAITPAKINSAIPSLEGPLAQLGALISPKGEANVHATIGAISIFTSNTPMAFKEQQALNIFLAGTPGFVPLAVDGKLGERTHNAIVLAQQKAGIKADGWLGEITAGAIGLAF